jgi:hypothetical protein
MSFGQSQDFLLNLSLFSLIPRDLVLEVLSSDLDVVHELSEVVVVPLEGCWLAEVFFLGQGGH